MHANSARLQKCVPGRDCIERSRLLNRHTKFMFMQTGGNIGMRFC